MNRPFWQDKSLQEMTDTEWESLCDGCGRCCLHKVLEEDTGQIHLTRVACRLLDSDSGRCRDYTQRHHHVPDCIRLTPENVMQLDWLPQTCAYRRLAHGEDLPEWHPLRTGDPDSTRRSGHAVCGWTISEEEAPDVLQHLIDTAPAPRRSRYRRS